MPIPAAAGLLAAVVHMVRGNPVPNLWLALTWMVVVGLAGFLMVSTWRFWSGKEINFSGRHPFQLLVLLALFIYALVAFSDYLLFILWFGYMFSGIGARFAYSWQRRKRKLREQPSPTV